MGQAFGSWNVYGIRERNTGRFSGEMIGNDIGGRNKKRNGEWDQVWGTCVGGGFLCRIGGEQGRGLGSEVSGCGSRTGCDVAVGSRMWVVGS